MGDEHEDWSGRMDFESSEVLLCFTSDFTLCCETCVGKSTDSYFFASFAFLEMGLVVGLAFFGVAFLTDGGAEVVVCGTDTHRLPFLTSTEQG